MFISYSHIRRHVNWLRVRCRRKLSRITLTLLLTCTKWVAERQVNRTKYSRERLSCKFIAIDFFHLCIFFTLTDSCLFFFYGETFHLVFLTLLYKSSRNNTKASSSLRFIFTLGSVIFLGKHLPIPIFLSVVWRQLSDSCLYLFGIVPAVSESNRNRHMDLMAVAQKWHLIAMIWI